MREGDQNTGVSGGGVPGGEAGRPTAGAPGPGRAGAAVPTGQCEAWALCAPLSRRERQRRAGHTAWNSASSPADPHPQLLPVLRARRGLLLRALILQDKPMLSTRELCAASPGPPGFQLTWSSCL